MPFHCLHEFFFVAVIFFSYSPLSFLDALVRNAYVYIESPVPYV